MLLALQLFSQLRSALAANAVRVIDLFREWDDEKDWLVQMTHNSGVSRATNSGRAGGK